MYIWQPLLAKIQVVFNMVDIKYRETNNQASLETCSQQNVMKGIDWEIHPWPPEHASLTVNGVDSVQCAQVRDSKLI